MVPDRSAVAEREVTVAAGFFRTGWEGAEGEEDKEGEYWRPLNPIGNPSFASLPGPVDSDCALTEFCNIK